MDERKRERTESGFRSNGRGFKKSKHESELTSGVGSKLKPCTKFFSTSGCQFGESCHFLHYVPGGYKAVAEMMNLPPFVPAAASRNAGASPSFPDGSTSSAVKTRICNRFNSAEGCKFGDKCYFSHVEREPGWSFAPTHDDPRDMGGFPGRMGGWFEPPATGFGASATTKISIDASLSGTIIGRGGINSKQICRQTGAKLFIKDHEYDPNLKNIELEGTFEQINQASAMVRELIESVGSMSGSARGPRSTGGHGHRGNNVKTKLCENYAKGLCTFAEKCNFAHGASELRRTGF